MKECLLIYLQPVGNLLYQRSHLEESQSDFNRDDKALEMEISEFQKEKETFEKAKAKLEEKGIFVPEIDETELELEKASIEEEKAELKLERAKLKKEIVAIKEEKAVLQEERKKSCTSKEFKGPILAQGKYVYKIGKYSELRYFFPSIKYYMENNCWDHFRWIALIPSIKGCRC